MSENITISILMDNTALAGFASEWGFSAAIEAGDELWLWDAGATPSFLANAALMGIDPTQAAGIALSHGHWDHTGGLPALFKAGFQGPVFAHPQFGVERHCVTSEENRPIGIPDAIPEYSTVTNLRPLNRSITMITDIPRVPGNFEAVAGFYFDQEATQPDPVVDDAFLVISTADGPVVQLGCCHSGLMNSLECVRERMDFSKIHAVIGGLHLYEAGNDAIEQATEACRIFNVQKLVPGHCTGEAAAAELERKLDCEIIPMQSGTRLTFSA